MTLVRNLAGLLLLAASGAAAATMPEREGAGAPSSARLVLVDDEMHDGLDAGGWRLDTESLAPHQADDGDLRLRVKVRPNRAMGRMSLSF